MHRNSKALNMRSFPQKCPACPPQSMRMFDEVGLLQHFVATSRLNSNPEVVRAHNALLYDILVRRLNMEPLHSNSLLHGSSNLDSGWQKHAPPYCQEGMYKSLHQPAKGKGLCAFDQNSGVKVVWPWMGIVMNIDYEHLAVDDSKSGKDNAGHANLCNSQTIRSFDDREFSCYNSRSVHVIWTLRTAVLDFGHDLLGCFDAEDFAKGFAQRARGKPDFLRKDHIDEMFGWIADENDYKLNDAVGQFLRKKGTLRIMPRFSHPWSEQYDQLFMDMRSKFQDRNLKLVELKKEVSKLKTLVFQAESEKHLAESQFSLKDLKHKQELEMIGKMSDEALQKSKDELLKEKVMLKQELDDVKEKCRLFEEKRLKITSDDTLLQQLIDAVEEKYQFECTVKQLAYKEREANDKLQNAMKAATEVLQIEGDKSSICIKRMGALNEEPWKKACAVRFKHEKGGWETAFKMLFSKWEDYLKDPSWYPYKVVPKQGDKFEIVLDSKDEKLTKLMQEFGAELYQTVVDALNELQDFNASGRFPVPLPWNFELGREAELDEIIRYLANEHPKRKRDCFSRLMQSLTYTQSRKRPCGVNLSHTHMRASEMLDALVSRGPLLWHFLGVQHIDILYANNIPHSLLQFELNVGKQMALYISALNSKNP
ncbi:hypothetical protein L7F22_014239 [Adiantum nelumboides]|nr:hypothetical protein [Adiantum nelumboides]